VSFLCPDTAGPAPQWRNNHRPHVQDHVRLDGTQSKQQPWPSAAAAAAARRQARTFTTRPRPRPVARSRRNRPRVPAQQRRARQPCPAQRFRPPPTSSLRPRGPWPPGADASVSLGPRAQRPRSRSGQARRLPQGKA
jgi:hypothetical protein